MQLVGSWHQYTKSKNIENISCCQCKDPSTITKNRFYVFDPTIWEFIRNVNILITGSVLYFKRNGGLKIILSFSMDKI
jgi:hypothetical protein